MKQKYFLAVLLCPVLLYLSGCSSGSYNVKNLPEGSDSTQIVQRDSSNPVEPIKGKTFRVRTIPNFTLTGIFALDLGFAELSSNYANRFESDQFIKGENFGVRNGYSAYLIGKLPLHPQGNIRLTISAGYNHFANDFMSDASPFGSVKYNVLVFGAGIENNFSPKYRLRPYVGGEITGNLISGDAVIDTATVTSSPAINVKIKSSFRIGISVYTGFEYLIANSFGLNFGVKLTHNNLLLKQSATDGTTEIPLRDKKSNEDPATPFAGFKSFVHLGFYMGANIYFGIKDIPFKF